MHRSPERTAAILDLVVAGELKIVQAATKLDLGRKQVSRVLRRYLEDGLEGLMPRNFGRRAVNGHSGEFAQRVVDIVRRKYADFGPTLAAEKLKERDGIEVSREWLRLAMIKAGIWKDRVAKQRRVHQLREPCERRGELVQIDGSHHKWFEERGPKCALLVFIDDATSELGHLEFAPSESAFAYMSATKSYLLKNGKPVAFYSDKHTIFKNPSPNLLRTEGRTQFMNVLQRLNIGLIYAETSQAHGRVERANRTLQDRLVKEMRLENVSSIEDGNAFLERYIAIHNRRFKFEPYDPGDAHQPLDEDECLDDLIRWEEPRKVTQALSLSYNKVSFILEPTPLTRRLAGQFVMVCEYPDGRVDIRYDDKPLPHRRFDKLRRISDGDIVDGKRLSAALALAKEMQTHHPHHRKRNSDAPVRSAQQVNIFPDFELTPKGVPVELGRSSPLPDCEETRVLSRQLSFQFKCKRYVLQETLETRSLIGKTVIVRRNRDGEIEISYNGEMLPYVGMPSATSVPDMNAQVTKTAKAADQPPDSPPSIHTLAATAPTDSTPMKRRRGRRKKGTIGPPTLEEEVDAILARAAAPRITSNGEPLTGYQT